MVKNVLVASSSSAAPSSAFELYVPSTTVPSSELVDDMVRVWWESNGMPTVLMDRATARYHELCTGAKEKQPL